VKQESHEPGACLAREGSLDDWLYLVVEGVARVAHGDTPLGELGPGSFFGEIAVFEGTPRSVTVTAATRMRLLRLERADLLERMDELPGFAIRICQSLSRRVRELTERVRREPKDAGPPGPGGPAAAERSGGRAGEGGGAAGSARVG
jgi:CRP-like cAMP-binding protein